MVGQQAAVRCAMRCAVRHAVQACALRCALCGVLRQVRCAVCGARLVQPLRHILPYLLHARDRLGVRLEDHHGLELREPCALLGRVKGEGEG